MVSQSPRQDAHNSQASVDMTPTEPFTQEELVKRRDVLAEIEKQCASHSRHPAEWNNDHKDRGWISSEKPAVAYVMENTSLPAPRRCRELVCELLGAGIPMFRTGHHVINNVLDEKRVTKAARKLVSRLREGQGFYPDIYAAVQMDILKAPHHEFRKAVRTKLAEHEFQDAEAAVLAVVRCHQLQTTPLQACNCVIVCQDARTSLDHRCVKQYGYVKGLNIGDSGNLRPVLLWGVSKWPA